MPARRMSPSPAVAGEERDSRVATAESIREVRMMRLLVLWCWEERGGRTAYFCVW
jgi:hypothetical protein